MNYYKNCITDFSARGVTFIYYRMLISKINPKK